MPPTAPSASRFPGPATKSRPIASTGLPVSTGSASPISPKYVLTSSFGRPRSDPSRW